MEGGTLIDGVAEVDATLPEKPQVVVDLANHPQHGNMLIMQQGDVARLLGVSVCALNRSFRATHQGMRWPCRRYGSLKTQVKRTKGLYKKEKISKEVRKARVKCLKAEMALLIKGPVEIRLQSK